MTYRYQAFSFAGKRRGFLDTRGTLFFEIARAAKQIQPQFLFLENVKGLLNHDKGNTFRTILASLDELGYDAEWCVCNNKWFGIPQNRERTFIVASLRGECRSEIFPVQREDRTIIANNIKRVNDAKKTKTILKFDSSNRIFDINGIAPTLTTHEPPKITISPKDAEKLKNARKVKIVPSNDGQSFLIRESFKKAVDDDSVNGIETKDLRIRKLTPRECWRLQSLPDWAFERAAAVVSATQLYKQAGNSVSQEVVYQIALHAFT